MVSKTRSTRVRQYKSDFYRKDAENVLRVPQDKLRKQKVRGEILQDKLRTDCEKHRISQKDQKKKEEFVLLNRGEILHRY